MIILKNELNLKKTKANSIPGEDFFKDLGTLVRERKGQLYINLNGLLCTSRSEWWDFSINLTEVVKLISKLTPMRINFIINSHGGSVDYLDIQWIKFKLKELTERGFDFRSYITSYGCSLAYLFACLTSKIYSHENSIIGNIGVYAQTCESSNVVTIAMPSEKVPTKENDYSPLRYDVNLIYQFFKQSVLESRLKIKENKFEKMTFLGKSVVAKEAPYFVDKFYDYKKLEKLNKIFNFQ